MPDDRAARSLEPRQAEAVEIVAARSHPSSEVAAEQAREEAVEVGRRRHHRPGRPRRPRRAVARVRQAPGGDAVPQRPLVAVEVRSFDRVGLEGRVGEAERLQDPPLQQLVEAFKLRTLEDEAEGEVVRARVGVPGGARLRVRDLDECARIELAAQERRLGGVVEEPGSVREQLADRDLVRILDEIRLEVGDGVVEREDVEVGEVERQRGDEGLRDAADAEAIVHGCLALRQLSHVLAVA